MIRTIIVIAVALWALIASFFWIEAAVRLGYSNQAVESLRNSVITLAKLIPNDITSEQLQRIATSNGESFTIRPADNYHPTPTNAVRYTAFSSGVYCFFDKDDRILLLKAGYIDNYNYRRQ